MLQQLFSKAKARYSFYLCSLSSPFISTPQHIVPSEQRDFHLEKKKREHTNFKCLTSMFEVKNGSQDVDRLKKSTLPNSPFRNIVKLMLGALKKGSELTRSLSETGAKSTVQLDPCW